MLKAHERERIVAMRHDGMTISRIADVVGCSETTVKVVLADGGLAGPRRMDTQKLARLWGTSMTTREIALEMGCSVTRVFRETRRLGLPSRAYSCASEAGSDDAPSDVDAMQSEDSLALSPYVQARIKELRLGMPV